MTREDLLKVIEVHKPSFCFEKIQPFKEEWWISIQPFVKEHIWEETSINVFRVAGTQHPDYQGITWSELIKKGKKMLLNLELFEKNPDYYLSTEHKVPTMYYIQIDGGDYHIKKDGHHRTCIAKFFFFLKGLTTLHGVEVNRYLLDHRALEVYRALKEAGRYVEPIAKKLSREDSSGWMREKFEILFLEDGRAFTVEEAEEVLKAGRRNRGCLEGYGVFLGRG